MPGRTTHLSVHSTPPSKNHHRSDSKPTNKMALRVAIPSGLAITSRSTKTYNTNTTGRIRPTPVKHNNNCFSIQAKANGGGLKHRRNRTEDDDDDDVVAEAVSSSAAPSPSPSPSTCNYKKKVIELERMFTRKSAEQQRFSYSPQSPSSTPPPDLFDEFSGRRSVRVAYQGVRGSYCQEATIKAFSSLCCCSYDAFPCHQMEDVFLSLEDNSADIAFVPIENSIDGPIHRNFDLLLRHHQQVEIVGEVTLPVNHCLLACPSTSTSTSNNSIKNIVSHPQALDHCKTNLQLLQHVHDPLEVQEVPNAADAANFLSQSKISDTAVIGSKIAAKEFGLEILQENFQDPNPAGNFNRFLQLRLKSSSRLPAVSSSSSKTTIAFSLKNGVSDLFRALWVFQSRNLTVTRLEHRPNKSNPIKFKVAEEEEKMSDGYYHHQYLDYVFILDVKGNVSQSALHTALSQLQEFSEFFAVLGSYTCVCE